MKFGIFNCGEWYEDMIDHPSYVHSLSSCEIKAWKKKRCRPKLILTHDLCETSTVLYQLCITAMISHMSLYHSPEFKYMEFYISTWYPGLNQQRFWRVYFPVYSLIFVSIGKIYQIVERVFHRLSKNTLNFAKNTPLCVVFSTLFSVFAELDETLSLVFDVLLLKLDDYTREIMSTAVLGVIHVNQTRERVSHRDIQAKEYFWQNLRCLDS